VSQLVAQLFQMRAQTQKLMGMMQGQEAIAGMGDLMDSLKAEEKVMIVSGGVNISENCSWRNLEFSEYLCIIQAPPGTARRKRRNSKPKLRDLDAVLS